MGRFFMPPHGSALRLAADQILTSSARSGPSDMLTLESRSATVAAVRAGVGVGVFAMAEVAGHLRRGDLVRLNTMRDGIELSLHLVHRREQRLTGPSKVFAEVVTAWTRDARGVISRAA
jgi:DNA-binding transcriptional LysR family regulator